MQGLQPAGFWGVHGACAGLCFVLQFACHVSLTYLCNSTGACQLPSVTSIKQHNLSPVPISRECTGCPAGFNSTGVLTVITLDLVAVLQASAILVC
jgi:hypothetical protein